MMALPLDDRTYLLSQSEQIARNPDNAAKGRAMQAIVSYVDSRVAERRDGAGDDVISTMTRARIGERPRGLRDSLDMHAAAECGSRHRRGADGALLQLISRIIRSCAPS